MSSSLRVRPTFSALSVEPLNETQWRLILRHRSDTFSALSVEPLNETFNIRRKYQILQAFSALSVEPLNETSYILQGGFRNSSLSVLSLLSR